MKGCMDGMREIDGFELEHSIILEETNIIVEIVDIKGKYNG